MGERCGCVSKDCTCGIFQGQGLIIQGTGTQENPHVIEIGPTSTKMVGVPSSYVNVAITGDGTAGSPYLVKMIKSLLSPPAAPIVVNARLTPGTYTLTKPTGCTLIEVVLIGGGAGGQGGGTDAYGTGGRGGPGGGRLVTSIPVSPGQYDCTLVVGAGGNGGTGSAAGPGSGNAGGDTVLTIPDNVTGTLVLKATGATPAQGILNGSPGLGSQDGQVVTGNYVPLLSDLRPGAGGRGGSLHPWGGPHRIGRAGGKHQQFVQGRINLQRNPNFDYGLNHWVTRANASLVWHTDTGAAGPQVDGIACMGVDLPATGTSEVQNEDVGQAGFPVKPNTVYGHGCKIWVAPGLSRGGRVGLGFWNAAGVGLFSASSGLYGLTPGAWNYLWTYYTTPADAAFARQIFTYEGGSAGETWKVDHARVEETSIDAGYFDGDYPTSGGVSYDWQGINAGGSSSAAWSEDVNQSLALRGGGIGGDGGNIYGPGLNGNGPGAGGGGGGGGGTTGGRGGDGAAWIIFN